MKHNSVEHPPHYCTHPSGMEAITISGQLNFALGNAFKYLFRCSHKGNTLEDMKKASWYLSYELKGRKRKGWFWKAWWLITDDDVRSLDFGCYSIRQILDFETRYCGHMAAALDAIYVAGLLHGGPESVERALRSVERMIKIEEDKLS